MNVHGFHANGDVALYFFNDMLSYHSSRCPPRNKFRPRQLIYDRRIKGSEFELGLFGILGICTKQFLIDWKKFSL